MTATRRATSILFLLSCIALSGCSQEPGKLPAVEPTPAPATPLLQTAPYAVGSTTLFIHEESRPFDSVAGVNSGVRTLITELWYPVDHHSINADSIRPTYGDYVFGNRSVHRRMMTQTTFFHLTLATVRPTITQQQIDQAIEGLFNRKRDSYVDAPVASSATPLPVIVMTHGDAGSRYNMQTVCEYLASHGYVVIAPDHTGNSPYAMIGSDPMLAEGSGSHSFKEKMAAVLPLLDEHGVYGRTATYGQSYTPLAGGFAPAGLAKLDRSLVQRVNDLRATLDTLESLNRDGEFAGKIDLTRIGLMGRSFGGLTTLAGLKLEERFMAGFAVVAPPLPDLRQSLTEPALAHAPRESALLAADGSPDLMTLRKPTLLLMASEDHSILKLNQQLASTTRATAPSAAAPYPAVQHSFDNASAAVVYSLVKNTNHASFAVSGPYWWPELKPDTFSQFFNPQSSYQLLPAATAHQIQKEMALAFFNLTIQGDQSSLRPLRDNPWGQHGALVQVRGFAQSPR